MPEAPRQSSGDFSTELEQVSDADLPQAVHDSDHEPEDGLEPEDVEDRPSVGTVRPDDYPKDRPDG